MPSSAKDRFTVDFEYVYFFVKSKKYWFEQQFEESIDPESYTGRRKRNAGTMAKYDKKNYLMAGSIQKNGTLKYGQKYPNRNKRAVWTIPTQPFPEAHFAVYPEGLIEPM
jgi:site-specific DNA-methyltransferase (adenine-specific)